MHQNDIITTHSEPLMSTADGNSNLEIFKFGSAVRPHEMRMMVIGVEERIKRGVELMEGKRQAKLEGQRKIGHVLGEKDNRKLELMRTHFFTPRKAPFEWQRLENSELGWAKD